MFNATKDELKAMPEFKYSTELRRSSLKLTNQWPDGVLPPGHFIHTRAPTSAPRELVVHRILSVRESRC